MGIYLVILLSLIFLVLLFIIFTELPDSNFAENFYYKLPLLLLANLINILIYSISIYLVYIYLF